MRNLRFDLQERACFLIQLTDCLYELRLELFLYKRRGSDEGLPGMNHENSGHVRTLGSFPECFANLFRNNSSN